MHFLLAEKVLVNTPHKRDLDITNPVSFAHAIACPTALGIHEVM
jgi:hypothetical protein